MASGTPTKLLSIGLAAALASSVLSTSGLARADESSPSGKGIVGGALLGGELVMTIEAAAGVQKPLPYVVGGILGAGAGGVGGYFVEHNASDARPSLYMLAAGLALAIPVTVLTLNATSYHPPPDYQEDKTGAEPAADAPQPAGAPAPTPPPATPSAPPPTSRLSPRATREVAQLTPMPTSVVDIYSGSVRLAVPAVEIRPVYSMTEMRQYGMQQKEEVRIPVFHASF